MRKDINGSDLSIGDLATVRAIPPELLSGLPEEDQKAISAQLGSTLSIDSFSPQDEAELEFVDDQGTHHTIWLAGAHLERLAVS